MEKRILILGIGNILLADEGFGPAAIELLQKNYAWPDNVSLVDGATRGLMLMTELMECDLAIVIDIALLGGQPGTFYLLEGKDLERSFRSNASMHQTGLADILLNCELIGQRPEAVIFAMEPFDCQTQQPWLSSGAKMKLPEFCERFAREIKKYGVFATPLQNTGSSD